MALLPTEPGPTINFVAAALSGGDTFRNDGTQFLLIVVTTARVLTIRNPRPGFNDYTQALPAGSNTSPRFDPLWWNDPLTGEVVIEFDDPVGVQLAAVRTGVILADPDAPPAPGLF